MFYPAGQNPIAIAACPKGKFLYVANWGEHTIGVYSIGSNGGLKPSSDFPFPSGRWPHSVAIAPSGRYLYTANGDSNDVTAYRIDAASGSLSEIASSPFAAGNHPEFDNPLSLGRIRLCVQRLRRGYIRVSRGARNR